jgi:cytochrome c peroxidase
MEEMKIENIIAAFNSMEINRRAQIENVFTHFKNDTLGIGPGLLFFFTPKDQIKETHHVWELRGVGRPKYFFHPQRVKDLKRAIKYERWDLFNRLWGSLLIVKSNDELFNPDSVDLSKIVARASYRIDPSEGFNIVNIG